MRTLKIVSTTLLTILMLVVVSCENNDETLSGPSDFRNDPTLAKKPVIQETVYPIWGKANLYNNKKKGMWMGGTISLSNGSKFTVQDGALTPLYPNASSVYISIRADFDSLNNQIIFSFSPHGCLFNPAAEVIMDWSDLGIDAANLYYIEEDGTYTQQTPDHIDFGRRQMTIYIDHFSRYAVGYD